VTVADDAATTPPDKRAALQSVQRAFAVLDEIVNSVGPVRASDLASSLGVDRAIVYRIVRTLAAEGLVERGPSGGYVIGPRSLVYGQAYRDRAYGRSAVLPFMADFARSLRGESQMVSMAVMVRSQMLLVDQIWSPNSTLDFMFDAGTKLPAVDTAAGRAVLAYMSESEGVEAVGREAWDGLQERLAEIRERGGVEFHQGVGTRAGQTAIAAAIFPPVGSPRVGLVLSGMGLDDEQVVDSVPAAQVRRYAQLISEALARVPAGH
jgi:DNA-binding IclR family transcriptional regulator